MRTLLPIALLAVALAGCESPPSSAPADAAIDYTQLPAAPPAPRPPEPVPDEGHEAPIRHLLSARRLVFPRPSPRLAFAVDALKPPDVDPDTLARWRANGFGVGKLPANQLPLFLANTRGTVGINYATHIGPTHWVPLVLIERITGTQPVNYVLPDGQKQRREIRNGRQQLMLKLDRVQGDAPGEVRLVVMPHHFKPDISLTPRTPQEKQLDGSPFFDLLLQARVTPDTVWIIWADLPPEVAAAADNGGARDTADDGPVLFPNETREAAEPVSLAESMLTGNRGTDRVQMIVILKVEPPAPIGNAPSPRP